MNAILTIWGMAAEAVEAEVAVAVALAEWDLVET